MGSGLDYLVSEGIVSEILARLKSGKEADVYVVRYGGNAVAAKVYKDRAHRSFKNNASYKEGRSIRNSRSQRAIDRGSKFGKAAAEDAWKTAEADALYKLHAAGVRVPTPVMYLEGVLLMELVLDAEGAAAPRLIDADLTPEEANTAYHDMLKQLVRILSCDLIHGDLSPYNVLWGASGPTIIDFPQIISASHNSNSETFFLRDARNILGHFAAIDRSLNARSGDAGEIWRAYARRELTQDFLPLGRPRFTPPRVDSARPGPDMRRSSEPRPQGHASESRPQHASEQRGQGRSSEPRPQHASEHRGQGRSSDPRPQHASEHRGQGRSSEPHSQGHSSEPRRQEPRVQGGEPHPSRRQASQPFRGPNTNTNGWESRPEAPQGQGRPARPPQGQQGQRNQPAPRPEAASPRPFAGQRRPVHVPEVIVRVHRFPGAGPAAVEPRSEVPRPAAENEKTEAQPHQAPIAGERSGRSRRRR